MPAAILVLGIVSVVLWIGTDVLRTRLIAQDTALIRAASEIQTDTAMAHLWLEEFLTGDASPHLAEVWRDFDRAEGVVRAMLEGGRPGSPLPGLRPLEDPGLRRQATILQGRIHEMRVSARRRQDGIGRGEAVGVGTAADDAFDRLFFRLYGEARALEQAIDLQMERDEAHSRLLLGALLAAWIVLIAIAATGMWSRERHRRAAEAALRHSEAQLVQAQKMEAVGRLAGGLAHDINNYVNAITSQCELVLMKAPPGDRVGAKMEMVIATAGKITALIRRLLAFSKQMPVAPQVIDLNEVVEGLRGMMKRLIGEDLQLETFLADDLWRTRVDPTQVEQIVVNLLVNAREASPRGGKVTIETSNATLGPDYLRNNPTVQAGEYVLLAFSDSGTGIAPEIRDRIFEPFFTTKEGTEARGLGLATVYGIVKQNAGHVAVYSEVGQGTTFRIYLPRTHEAATIQAPTPAAAWRIGGGETLLLVEDNDELRSATHGVLEALGYRVATAANGEEALAALEARGGQIDLAICDVVMPGMSGPEVVERLRARSPGMRVIFMSGYTDNVVVRHGILEGEYDFLEKPFSADRLAAKIRGALATVPS
ncbi:MAG TPA: response regulator [Thermoanaerobaculia bacterium]|jgi:signal transduction histidine kinase|nr:response regulator [Thermoanaerobaculia bacterium]